MSTQLYVFETISPTGYHIVGTAGLPKRDMLNLMTFYNNKVTRIVYAPGCSSRAKIVTPVCRKKNEF